MSRRYWFAFTGSDGQEGDQSKYNVSGLTSCSNLGPHLCIVYSRTTLNGLSPDSSDIAPGGNLASYIADAKATHLPTPFAGPPYFVYPRT